MKRQTCVFLSSIIFAVSSQTLIASDHIKDTDAEAKKILLDAMTDAQLKADQFHSTKLLSFTREKIDRDGEIESYRYTPKSEGEGVWKKLNTEYSTNKHDAKVWEHNIFFSAENFILKDVKFMRSEAGLLFYDMPVHLSLTVDSDSIEEQKTNVDTFRTKLSVHKKSGRIHSFSIYSTKEFSPQLGVTVTSYQSHNTLREVTAGGPLIITEQAESVRGDFGFFISLDEDTKITNFDFTITEK